MAFVQDIQHMAEMYICKRCRGYSEMGGGFESGISHNDPNALQDHCVIM